VAKTPTQIKSLARSHTEQAVNTLRGCMLARDAPWAAKVQAATAMLDRGWGKPTQPIAGDDEHDPITVRGIAWLDQNIAVGKTALEVDEVGTCQSAQTASSE
jgi:hypothetical protein